MAEHSWQRPYRNRVNPAPVASASCRVPVCLDLGEAPLKPIGFGKHDRACDLPTNLLILLASPAGFEPTTPGLGILCSILLSYGDLLTLLALLKPQKKERLLCEQRFTPMPDR